MVAQGAIKVLERPGGAIAFFLRIDANALAELGGQPLRLAVLRGGTAAAAAVAAGYAGTVLLVWALVTGLGRDAPLGTLVGQGLPAAVTALAGALAAIPAIRSFSRQLPEVAVLVAYALPAAGLLSAALWWVSGERIGIASAWGTTANPNPLSDLASVIGRQDQAWAIASAAVLVLLLAAIPWWLRTWLRFGRASRPDGPAGSPQNSDMTGYHRRVRDTRLAAERLRGRPPRPEPEFVGRPDISVVARDIARRMPAWLEQTADANSALGRPALVIFLVCLLLRAFLSDPGLDRFPTDNRTFITLDANRPEANLTVPLGPEILGARLYALSGSGSVEVSSDSLVVEGPQLFTLGRAAQSQFPATFDLDLSGADPGRGMIALRSGGNDFVQLELRLQQQFTAGERVVAAGLAVATGLLTVAGTVLALLGLVNLRAYRRR